MKQIVHTKLTDNKGCTVQIDGEIEFSLFPLVIEAFTGTINLNGGNESPAGTLNFGGSGCKDVRIQV